ncbi:hypothetical protein [Edaphobacter modestus]|uniref:Uncharacterized protein n=1 Tax=Edaphobacter modestus TaxID=388466 RepID=A0A4Q7Z0F4_9BACT|nr:hypothetical protein [Edaphobacter modestus]RZU42939.1 hypothetical protein BDD14_4540 [Edaphobacter modestus]
MNRFRDLATVMLVMATVLENGVAQSAALNAPSQSAASASAPTGGRSSGLVVRGYDGQAPLTYRDGQAYVEVEGLARVIGASIAFQGTRMVLTLSTPTAPASAAAPVAPAPQPKEERGFSREFLRAGVEQMTVVREWRSAIENAIRTNNPVDQSWVSGYRSNAQSRMGMATASATTDADRQALPLLQSAMAMMQQLSDRFLALRTTASYVSPDTLDNDPLDQKILACAQGMAAIAIPGGQFQDVDACH